MPLICRGEGGGAFFLFIQNSFFVSSTLLTQMHKQCESMEWRKRWNGESESVGPAGRPCTELLAPTIFHTLKHWYQYTYLGL